MKKVLFILFALISITTHAQVANGTETKQNAFRSLSPQTVTSPTYLATMGTDGTIGRVLSTNVNELKANKDTGLLSGGVISVNVDNTKWNLAAGNGYVTNSLTGVTVAVSWIAQNALTTPFLNTSVATYVLIDENGLKVLQNTPPTQQQFRTHIYLGKLAHTTLTTILFAVSEPSRMFDVSGQITDLNRFLGSGNVEGNIISANGANLNINASAGMTYRPGANYSTDRNSPSITTEPAVTAGSFRRKYRNGSGGWTAVNSTTIDPNNYDNGSGTLVAIPNNKWTIQVFWRFGGTGTIHCDYGQVVYDNKVDALAAAGKAAVAEDPDNKRDASKRAWLVVQQNTTALNNLSVAEFVSADKFGERSAGGSSTATHQSTYLNSTTPQIVTNSTQGALTIKRGSAADTDNVFVVQNGAGTNTFEVKGNGAVTVATPINATDAVNKSYADGLVVGLLDDRGTYNASSNLFPSTGGSGTGGAILKGDIWYVGTAGTLGGKAVAIGDSFRALVDSPGQTASNWGLLSSNLSYVPANDANVVHLTGNEIIQGIKSVTNSTAPATNAYVFSNSSTGYSNDSSNATFQIINSNSSLGGHVFNSGSGIGFYGWNTGTGILNNWDSQTGSTGDLLTFSKNNILTGKIDHLGNLTATSVIKLGATSTNLLLAGGGDISQSNFAPSSGSSNYIQNQNASAQSANMWITGSGFFENTVLSDIYGGLSGGNTVLTTNTSGSSNLILKTTLLDRLVISGSTGVVQITNLAGTGTRTVVADASGNLSATSTAPTSGTYIPTYTNTANVSSFTHQRAFYSVVDKVVHVTIKLTANVTSATAATAFEVTTPSTRSSSSFVLVTGSARGDLIAPVMTTGDTTTSAFVELKPPAGSTATAISVILNMSYEIP